jgi:hypothetical protein
VHRRDAVSRGDINDAMKVVDEDAIAGHDEGVHATPPSGCDLFFILRLRGRLDTAALGAEPLAVWPEFAEC